MKKIILTTLIGSFVVLPVLTMAIKAGDMPTPTEYGTNAPTIVYNPLGLVGILINVVKWVYTAFFIITVLVLLFAAYTYLTAGGDPAKISAVHKQLIYAAIAVVIALIAVSFSWIIQQMVTNS